MADKLTMKILEDTLEDIKTWGVSKEISILPLTKEELKIIYPESDD